MKRLVMKITRPLSLVPVDLGEKFAWWLFLVVAGFIAGWASVNYQWQTICFPMV
jgi:hypothetical protein